MILYIFMFICFIFTLIAISINKDGEFLKNILHSVVTHSILLCIVRLNFYLKTQNGSMNTAPITILVLISVVSYLIYQFKDARVRWK